MLLARHGTRGAIPVRIGQHKGKRLRTEKPILFYHIPVFTDTTPLRETSQEVPGWHRGGVSTPPREGFNTSVAGFQRHQGRVSTLPKHYCAGLGRCLETNWARATSRTQSVQAEVFHLTVSLHPSKQSFYCLAGSSSREMTNSCSMASFHQAASAWKVAASSPLSHGMNHAQRAPAAHCSEMRPTVDLVASP